MVTEVAGREGVEQRAEREKVKEGDSETLAVGVWIFLRIHRRVYALSHGEWHSRSLMGKQAWTHVPRRVVSPGCPVAPCLAMEQAQEDPAAGRGSRGQPSFRNPKECFQHTVVCAGLPLRSYRTGKRSAGQPASL